MKMRAKAVKEMKTTTKKEEGEEKRAEGIWEMKKEEGENQRVCARSKAKMWEKWCWKKKERKRVKERQKQRLRWEQRLNEEKERSTFLQTETPALERMREKEADVWRPRAVMKEEAEKSEERLEPASKVRMRAKARMKERLWVGRQRWDEQE